MGSKRCTNFNRASAPSPRGCALDLHIIRSIQYDWRDAAPLSESATCSSASDCRSASTKSISSSRKGTAAPAYPRKTLAHSNHFSSSAWNSFGFPCNLVSMSRPRCCLGNFSGSSINCSGQCGSCSRWRSPHLVHAAALAQPSSPCPVTVTAANPALRPAHVQKVPRPEQNEKGLKSLTTPLPWKLVVIDDSFISIQKPDEQS